MQERRQFARLDTRLDISYTETSGTAPRKTVSKNVSGGGVCLFLEKELPAGTPLQVAMNVPGREPPVKFSAEVVWCEPYEVIGKTQRHRAIEAGVHITDITPQDYQALLGHVILSLNTPRK